MTLLLNFALMAEVKAASVGIEKVAGDNLTTSEIRESMNMHSQALMQQCSADTPRKSETINPRPL